VTGVLGARIAPWPLAVGDRARELDVHWLQGAPVDPTNANGQIVVVELWATWCGPCIGSIPDLDALQRRYAHDGVRVVAVAVRDELESVQRFVAERGSSLAYAIAFDANGKAWKRWRENWFTNGIPCSFVVGRDGRIACITHPALLDGVIARMLDGTWPNVESDDRSDSEEAWHAGQRQDRAALAACGERLRLARPKSAYGWTVSVHAVRTAAERAELAGRAIEAVGGDADAVAYLVLGLAGDGALQPCAPAADAAMRRLPAEGRGFHRLLARLHLAHALGDAALDNFTADVCGRFADQPYELLALALAVVQWGVEDVPGLTVHPPRRALDAAALRCLESARGALAPRNVGDVYFRLLVTTGADAARIEQAGEQVVAAMASDARALNGFAWDLLMDAEHLAVTRATALRAAEAMMRIPGWDMPSYMDTAALARFENGDVDGAIELQGRAVAAMATPDAAYQQRLERFERAKAQAPSGR
jgi:thiol-disulfide isomerase/thioredoxin